MDRPDEVAQVVSILVSHGHDGGERLVGLSAVVRGAGGFGKTVVASLVRRHPRVLRRFTGGVYWVTLGRGMESPAALAGRVSQLIARLDPEQQVSFTDPEQAAEHLAAVLAVGPRRLLILDDVWHANQLRAFPVAGHCARLITTRMPSVVAGASMIPVGEVTQEQAATIVNFGLVTPVSRDQLRELLAETGRYPLLLRLVNEILSDQVATGRVVDDAAATVITQLREAGTGGVERLTRDAGRSLDIDDPVQRSRAIAATIEASLGLLALEHRHLFAQTAVFVEDEVVPIHLVNTLWAATAGLDEAQTRALCVRLQDLALVSVDDTVSGGAIRLHGVIRDHLHASLRLDALTHLHQRLVTAVAGTVPTAAAAAASEDAVSSADQVRAWWLLPESERYMYDHLIDHLLAADRVAEAEQLATDLRWVARRLHQAGATAPYTDLTRLTTMRARDLARLFGGVAHLLGPTNPPHSRLDILCSRVAHDPIWGPQTAELLADQPGTHLVNQWNLTDLPSPSLRRTFTSHDGAVNAMAVSSDGTWLAAAISDAVWLWDTATGKHRATLTPDRGSVNAVAIAPDGTWLTTISGYEGTVQLWDVTTGESRAILNGPEGLEHSAAVCPDGTWFATASSFDPKVRLWDAVTGKARAKLVGHQSAVNAVVISPDGTWIATVETYKRMVVLWNAATGEPHFTLRGHSGWVEAVAISADGTWLAAADQDGYIKLWDSATGKHRSTLTDGADMVEAMAIAPDGTWLATAHYDGTTRLWDIATGETRAVLTGHTGKVNAVAIAPDGTWLATASDDGTVRLWDAATCERRSILSSNTDGVVAAAIPLEESQIATTDRFHETVQLWAAANDKPRTVVATPGSASTAYAPDGTWFARRDDQDDRIVHLYDVPTGERRHSLTGHTDVVQIVIVAPDGTWLATATSSYDDNVRLWDTSTGEVRHILSGHTKGVDRIAIAPDGSWLATASGGTIRLWDTSTGGIRAVLAHESTFMVAPDGTWLATSGWSGTIRIWDTTTGKNRTTLIGHTKWITALVVSLDGTWLTTASYDRTARLWDTATGKNRAILIGHQSTVREIVVSPDETRIATVGADRSVRVWDAITSEAIAMMRFDRQPNKIAWSPSADEIAVLDGGANSYLFKIRAE